jgi:hypothetical protein
MSESIDALHGYVRSALVLHGYAFSDAQVAEITAQFARIAAIAETILLPAAKPPADLDPGTAPVFRP